MAKLCEGRVAVVTGAGRGIGREHALMLAEHGAKVVVNDLGGEFDGTGADITPAQETAEDIRNMGGEAVVNGDDVSDWEGAQRMINTAVEHFGRLDVLVNNAGILRDRMLTNMTEDEWDAVVKVHLKGTFAPARWASAYWRELSKAGEPVDARIINTTSVSGIYGNPGQTNYGAAKAGIAAFTVIAAQELYRYGVTVNCLSPGALTRMTEPLQREPLTDEVREQRSPRWIAPICVWLASPLSKNVTGRVFQVSGRGLGISEMWRLGPEVAAVEDAEKLTPVVADLMSRAALNVDMQGRPVDGPGRPGRTI
jgi:NAD(P)-dependent dehydrogenase (short-subunit alcohol dehydrogenase family)